MVFTIAYEGRVFDVVVTGIRWEGDSETLTLIVKAKNGDYKNDVFMIENPSYARNLFSANLKTFRHEQTALECTLRKLVGEGVAIASSRTNNGVVLSNN